MPVIPKEQVGQTLATNQALINGLVQAALMADEVRQRYAKPVSKDLNIKPKPAA